MKPHSYIQMRAPASISCCPPFSVNARTATRSISLAASAMDARCLWLSFLFFLSRSSLYAHSQSCRVPEFVKGPESVEVTEGESASFFCILTGRPIDAWFLNSTYPLRSIHPESSYVSWSSCTPGDPGLCGGTLYIKKVDMGLNGTTVSCHVAHNCNGRNVSMSRPALIIVMELSSVESIETSSTPQNSSSPSFLSPSPSPPPSNPTRKPPVHTNDKEAEAGKTSVKVTERLVQRVPLMAAAAGICFVVGCVFGTMCAVTIFRGTRRCRRHKHRRRRRRSDVQISSPVQSQTEPNYAELTPVRMTSSSSRGSSGNHASPSESSFTTSSNSHTNNTNNNNNTRNASNNNNNNSTRNASHNNNNPRSAGSSGASPGVRVPEGERRENDYTELGMPNSPQFQRHSPSSGRGASSSAATNRGSGAVYADEDLPGPPLPPRGGTHEEPPQCQTCIEVDLDELEAVVLQQN